MMNVIEVIRLSEWLRKQGYTQDKIDECLIAITGKKIVLNTEN